MKTIITLSFLMLFISQSVVAKMVRVTSLNVEWYGRGGVISGSPALEYRNKTLKSFLTEALPKTDIFVFQEITEPEMLIDLFSELDCFTYETRMARHQHIVMCAEEGTVKQKTVNHDVNLGNSGLRSALLGKIEFTDGSELSLVGLHLKAGPYKTDMRLEQIRALLKNLNAEDESLIIGDLNTYPKERTGLDKSDDELISELLEEKNFFEVKNQIPTYIGYQPKVFDRAWGAHLQNAVAKVYGPCDSTFSISPYADRNFYERFVSDHCALQIEFKIEKTEASPVI